MEMVKQDNRRELSAKVLQNIFFFISVRLFVDFFFLRPCLLNLLGSCMLNLKFAK